MASRITHLAIKSPRFFFLKCTFFNQSGAGKRMINIQLSKQKDNWKKILNSPSNPSTKQINTEINIRATDLLCSAWKCHVTTMLTAQIWLDSNQCCRSVLPSVLPSTDSRVKLIFFLVVFLFQQLYIDHSFTCPRLIKKSAFKEEKSWRFDTEVSNSRRHGSIFFFLLWRV